MTISAVASYVPVDQRPAAFAVSSPAAVEFNNRTTFELTIYIGPGLRDIISPGDRRIYAQLNNLSATPTWVSVVPYDKADSLKLSLSTLSSTLDITSYGVGDPLPAVGIYTPGNLTPPAIALRQTTSNFRPLQRYNIVEFGAIGDGVTDNTAAIQAAYDYASNVGGGNLYIPAGVYISQTITMRSLVNIRGDGIGVSVIKLKAGTNADLFQAFPASIAVPPTFNGFQAGPATAVNSFTFEDFTLDGNQSGQSSGPCYPLRMYAYGYTLRNFEVRNGWSGGVLCDYSGPYPSSGNPNANDTINTHRLESTWENVKVHTNTGGSSTAIGISFYGPHDSRWTNVLSYVNNSHSVHHTGNNAGGLQAVNCHAWQPGMNDANSVSWLCESSLYAVACEAEGSPYGQLAILTNGVTWYGGSIYTGGALGWGLKIGQTAGGTPFTNSSRQSAGLTTAVFTSSYIVETLIQNVTHANGGIWLAQDSGGIIRARLLATNGTDTIISGTPAAKSTHVLNAQGYNDARQQILYYNTGPSFGQTATAPDPGTGGTINTSGIGVARVSPAGNITGVILQPGNYSGQVVWVVNESGFTITFAAVGTSHVGDGVGDVIAANTARGFVYDTGTNIWYRMG